MTEQATQVRCLRCRRRLTAAGSVSAGYGRTCRARIVAAAAIPSVLDGFTARQRDKAAELIGDKGIVPTGMARVWRTVSSSGADFYMTAPEACNCPAGLNGHRCYHSAAATLLAASLVRAA